nr:hemerythrin domain-containing protein [Methanolobus chelungpuianus]
MEEDSAWITLGFCEVNDTAANDTAPANDTQDIFITLESEHENITGLLEEAIGTGSMDTFMQVREELYMHMTGEEEVVYPALRDIGLEEHALMAEQEHEEVKMLISELEVMEEEDETWTTTLIGLQQALEEHVMHEEEVIFPLVQEQLSAEEAQRLEEEYQDSKGQANTESINTTEVQVT